MAMYKVDTIRSINYYFMLSVDVDLCCYYNVHDAYVGCTLTLLLDVEPHLTPTLLLDIHNGTVFTTTLVVDLYPRAATECKANQIVSL